MPVSASGLHGALRAMNQGEQLMWSGFDPELRRQLESIRELVALRHQTPVSETPLVFVDEFDALLIVREWPDGAITTYATDEYSDIIRENGGHLT
jgi:hypothetical protein